MPPAPETQTAPAPRRGIRWWPVPLILLALLIALVWIRLHNEANHQQGNIQSVIACFWAGVLGAVWFLFLSRIRWKIRFFALGVAALLGLLLVALFDIHGVTGNLVPVLRWRWSQPPVSDLSGLGSTNAASGPALPNLKGEGSPGYPQFLGPQRNATVSGPALARDWDARPPRLLWRQPIGAAWSGFAVQGARAVTQEQQEEKELVVCYDLLSGRPLWVHADQERYETTLAGIGPRATPALDGELVFALGAKGILNCLELASGRLLWSTNILESNQARLSSWGVSGSPLVVGDMVVVSPGGKEGRSLVAYDKRSGRFLWGGGDDRTSYSSPCLLELQGRPQLLIFNARNLAAHDVETGEVLWKYPWGKGQPHVALPVLLPGDQLLVSTGYGVGAERLQISQAADGSYQATQIWKSNRMKAKFTNLVYHDGHIYGLDDGIMACIDVETGSRQWKDGRYGHGQVILVGNLLLVMCENGDVALLDPVPEEHRELTRFQALRGKTWNPPALAGPHLVVRNDQEAACYLLPLAGE